MNIGIIIATVLISLAIGILIGIAYRKKVAESKINSAEEEAKKIGVGAVIFSNLCTTIIKDQVFDWDTVLNFNGETGPYIQYIYVRTNSVLEKAGYIPEIEKIDFRKLLEKEAIDTIKLLYRFNELIESAAEKNEPSLISRYLIDVAQSFSGFYHEHKIITEDKLLQEARLALTYAVGNVLKTGVTLLGMEMPNKM